MKTMPSITSLVAELFADADTEKTPVTPPGAPLPAASATPTRARKLWELEHKHHCPIVGTCLTIDELRRLARCHTFAGDPDDDFALHVEAASRADTRNPISLDIQRQLDRKYALVVRRFAAIDGDLGVRQAWKEHLGRGEVSAALWAILTHRAASPATRQIVYSDIHMLSHQVGAGQAADSRRLAELGRNNRQLKDEIERERRERTRVEQNLRQEVNQLRAKTVRLLADLDATEALRRRLASFEAGIAYVDIGRKLLALTAANEQLSAAAQRADELGAQLRERDAALVALRRDFTDAVRERDALEKLVLATTPAPDATDCPDASGGCALTSSARCVLCVGGRTALVAQYRALAERLGIRLIHHDGGQEESVSRLPEMINGSDAVLCPTDCVSHTAYYRLKNHCKRTGKPCLLFKGAGVSSFAIALAELAGGRSNLAVSAERSP